MTIQTAVLIETLTALTDGSVRFISENIYSGDPSSPPVTNVESPYGVWGALGSKDGEKLVGDL